VPVPGLRANGIGDVSRRINVASKPAPVFYTTDITGVTPYGEASGHIEVSGEAVGWRPSRATATARRVSVTHEKGLGVARDDALAAQWYAKSAAAGDKMGQSWLGTMYRDGRGVVRNYKEAEKWLSRAAEQGRARLKLGTG
jgi:TPR repeat protein